MISGDKNPQDVVVYLVWGVGSGAPKKMILVSNFYIDIHYICAIFKNLQYLVLCTNYILYFILFFMFAYQYIHLYSR